MGANGKEVSPRRRTILAEHANYSRPSPRAAVKSRRSAPRQPQRTPPHPRRSGAFRPPNPCFRQRWSASHRYARAPERPLPSSPCRRSATRSSSQQTPSSNGSWSWRATCCATPCRAATSRRSWAVRSTCCSTRRRGAALQRPSVPKPHRARRRRRRARSRRCRQRPSNIRLRCRAHNLLAAEQTYGRRTIAQIIARRRRRRHGVETRDDITTGPAGP